MTANERKAWLKEVRKKLMLESLKKSGWIVTDEKDESGAIICVAEQADEKETA